MTDDQVNLVVRHLCEQLHLTLRLKGSEAHPPNAKDIGFDPASVRTVLLTFGGLHNPPRGNRGERRAAVVLNAKRETEARANVWVGSETVMAAGRPPSSLARRRDDIKRQREDRINEDHQRADEPC